MPYPASDGGKQGSLNMLVELQHKMDIVLVYPIVSKEQLAYVDDLKKVLPKVKLYPFKYYKNKGRYKSQYFLFRLHRILTKKFLKQPYLATPVYQDEYLNHVKDIIHREQIDIVQNEYFEQLFLVYALPDNVKKIFIQHEIQYVAKERMIAQQDYPLSVNYLARLQKENEIVALNQYDKIITMTDIDKAILEKDGVITPIYSSPSFIPLQEGSYYKDCQRNSICFIGGSGHYPNLNGVTWFLDEVWPLILDKKPDFQFKIVGKWNPEIIEDYKKKYKNIVFLGFVENLSFAISDSIMIVPIKIGSGIRMKILEAVNCYVPFVTTTVGVEGLDFKNDKDCIITDVPKEMAEGIVRISSDSILSETFAKKAYETLVNKYSPKASSNRRLIILNN